MNTEHDEIRDLLAAEAAVAEDTRDQPIPDHARSTRPGHARSSVFSVRLNTDEMDALTAAAQARGVPASTLARSLILLGLRTGLADGLSGTPVDPSLRAAIHDEVTTAVRDALTDRDVA